MTRIIMMPKEVLKKYSPVTFTFLKSAKTKILKRVLVMAPNSVLELSKRMEEIETFAFPNKRDISQDLKQSYSYAGELGEIFTSNEGVVVHKWHHYIPIYEEFFSKYKNKEVRFLEIGVSLGGSLQMWRRFFGPKAIIFGIDIDPNCAKLDGIHGQVRIGSQTDEEFLRRVISEMGGVDVILDDGSHDMKHVKKTLKILFPDLSINGVYLIEDLHTAFWKSFHGGYRAKNNFVTTISKLTKDMHSWYHPFGKKLPEISDGLNGIHIYDSIVVLEKGLVVKPRHSQVG